MDIIIHPHAKERMEQRGITEFEIKETIKKGENFVISQSDGVDFPI